MTAYEMRISDWSSDVCSSDLPGTIREVQQRVRTREAPPGHLEPGQDLEQRNHFLLAVEEVVIEVLHGIRAERVLEVGEVVLEPRRGRQVGGAAEHRRDAAEGAVEAAAGRYLVGHGAVAQVGAGEVAARVAQFFVGEQ